MYKQYIILNYNFILFIELYCYNFLIINIL